MTVLDKFQPGSRKNFAVLIDPDRYSDDSVTRTADAAGKAGVDLLFIGGSLMSEDRLDRCITLLKSHTVIPLVLFPGSLYQIHPGADAILLLSLISGRNPDLLIGKHVVAAPYLRQSGLQIIPTGYMLIDGGRVTTAQYVSNTLPIPADKDEIAVNTAMAGEMLGLELIYLDAGSGANTPVPVSMIESVRRNISLPLIIGGGIRTPDQAVERCMAGADVIVVGNALENNLEQIARISQAIHSIAYEHPVR